MRAFVVTARVRIGDPRAVEEGIEDAVDRVMEKPVAHRGFVYVARLRIGNLESVIEAMLVCSSGKILMQLNNVVHKRMLKFLHVLFLALAGKEFSPGREQILDGYDIFE